MRLRENWVRIFVKTSCINYSFCLGMFTQLQTAYERASQEAAAVKQTVQSATAKDDQSRAMVSELTAVSVDYYITGCVPLNNNNNTGIENHMHWLLTDCATICVACTVVAGQRAERSHYGTVKS